MSNSPKKFYVVWEGRQPGIYNDWQTCSQQIREFPSAKYKSFPNQETAETAFSQGYEKYYCQGGKQAILETLSVEKDSVCVDVCLISKEIMQCKAIETFSQKEVFVSQPLQFLEKYHQFYINNLGKFLATVEALAIFVERQENTTIYTDNPVIVSWVKNRKVNTKLPGTEENLPILEKIGEAIDWLKSHAYQNRVKFWDPTVWGSFPKVCQFSLTSTQSHQQDQINSNSLCVDAACDGSPGAMEYRGVETVSNNVIFHKKFPIGTNNIGEFLAIVHALALLQQKGQQDIAIYSDSTVAMGWVKNKKAKTKLVRNVETEPIYQLIERAEIWLRSHTYSNPLLKWHTEIWGEIPADFGRKK
jgi:ribonuclease HI